MTWYSVCDECWRAIGIGGVSGCMCEPKQLPVWLVMLVRNLGVAEKIGRPDMAYELRAQAGVA